MSTRRGRGRAVTATLVVLSAVAAAGCSREPEPPECVGTVVEDAERVAEMVPSPLSGGGRAVANEIDMMITPPTADLTVTAPSLDEPLRIDVSVGSTFDAEGTTYEVVQVCMSRLYVVALPA